VLTTATDTDARIRFGRALADPIGVSATGCDC
jgi:hypothetical protein